MKCSFDEEIKHSDGSFTRTTCVNQATILIVSDPCYGLCYRCAYQKLRAKNTKLKEALRCLYDEQNGPPLIRYQKHWRAAMKLAGEVLKGTK